MRHRVPSQRARVHGSPVRRIELSQAALGFLELLQDLGHLDERLFEGIIESLAQQLPKDVDAPQVIEYEDVRRRVASMLMEEQTRLEPRQQELLNKEWMLLFG